MKELSRNDLLSFFPTSLVQGEYSFPNGESRKDPVQKIILVFWFKQSILLSVIEEPKTERRRNISHQVFYTVEWP